MNIVGLCIVLVLVLFSVILFLSSNKKDGQTRNSGEESGSSMDQKIENNPLNLQCKKDEDLHISGQEAKNLSKKITEKLKSGKTKRDVFQDLRHTCSNEKELAGLLAQIPDFELRKRYKRFNKFLVGMMIFTAMLKMISGLGLILEISVKALPLLLLFPLLNIYLAVEISRYKGWAYLVTACLSFLAMGKVMPEDGLGSLDAISLFFWGVSVAVFLCVMVLSFFLWRKLCPTVGFAGIPKKDSNGEYIW